MENSERWREQMEGGDRLSRFSPPAWWSSPAYWRPVQELCYVLRMVRERAGHWPLRRRVQQRNVGLSAAHYLCFRVVGIWPRAHKPHIRDRHMCNSLHKFCQTSVVTQQRECCCGYFLRQFNYHHIWIRLKAAKALCIWCINMYIKWLNFVRMCQV